ncbi:dolichyl-diphosphooligosaccharide---protein glycotransferase [Powellomyces hirtus]|uniref:Dolichyl-diphosphooligosaccharide--protein glycosyltransferase subunit 1 n=1 Tax=Powellomyces hirtus TaxID=109895 RepID=A0A507DTA7_9FUNG|nr:dolichyl-diphosphooligosaccharide---protein glycotransferase [Powellomyces hirtus]
MLPHSRSTAMRLCLLTILAILSFTTATTASSAAAVDPTSVREDFINTNLHRILDLTNPSIMREHSTVVIKAVNDAGAKEYYLTVPAEISEKSLAVLEVEVRQSKNGEGVKAVVMKDKYDASRSAQLYKVKLPNHLKKDEVVYLIINAAYTNAVKPFPKEVTMKSMQHLEYQGNAYLWSPYRSERQKTTVRVPRDEVLRFTSQPEPVTKNGNVVTYGPYDNVEPYASGFLHVHYADPKAILVVKSLERKMEISHLGGNLAVQEDYELHHEGAKLKGHFSRVDYSFSQWNHHQTNVVKDLTITLPPDAKHVFYRDTIGNVSTSNLRHERQRSVLNIRPRYPVYGGWKYTWHHGYNVPTTSFLKRNTEHPSQFAFRIPFIGGLPNVTITKAVVSIVFPEGAKNFKIRKPFDMDRVSESTTYTYLDTTGRPTITFEKHNVVDEHSQPLLITYELPATSLLQKPFAVSLAFFALFALGAVYSRLDLSITKDPKAEQEQLLQTYRSTVDKLARAETRLVNNLASVFRSLKSEKRLAEYKDATADIEVKIKAGWAKLVDAAKQAENAVLTTIHPASSSPTTTTKATTTTLNGSLSPAATFAAQIRQLQRLQEQRLAKMRAMHEHIVRATTAKSDAKLDPAARKELESVVANLDREIEQLAEQIRVAGQKLVD